MYNLLKRSEQKEARALLIGFAMPFLVVPPSMMLAGALFIAIASCFLGLSGVDSASNFVFESYKPIVFIMGTFMLPVYLALVMFFCHCWEAGTSKTFDFTKNLICGILRSTQFPALLPTQAKLRHAASTLPILAYVCRSRPERERPQFVAGENPPLKYY